MKIENEWLENEMHFITSERKIKRKICETMQISKIIFLLTIVFFYMPFADGAKNYRIINQIKAVEGGGQTFRCPKCHTRQWHADNTKDWNGKFHCPSCKTQLN